MPYADKLKYFHYACQNVVNNKDQKSLNYAVNYARRGLNLKDETSVRVQALYLRSYLSSWRGPIAKETRSILDKFIRVTA